MRPSVPVRGAFDAYCATVFAQPDALYDDLFCLMESAGLGAVRAEGPKVRFYARNLLLNDLKGHRLLSLKAGGSNPHPWVECTGEASGALATHLRGQYGHRPTRIDHCYDVRSAGLFEEMREYARSLCKRYGLKLGYGGDWNNEFGGRTIYIGSRTSQVFVRIYEKGLKYAFELGLPVTDELREWVRFELEFKPKTKVAKLLAPSIEGPQMWGSTNWTSQLAHEVLAMQTEPVTIRERKESKTEAALRYMGQQYSRHGRVLFDECQGDFCQFGRAVAVLFGIEEADL